MTLQRAALWAIVVAATIYLLVAGRGLLLPFVLGLVLWYMIDALADAFEQPRIGRLRLPRPVALLAAVCVMGGLVWVVGRTIGRNISAVAAAAPNYERRLQILINEGARLVGVEQVRFRRKLAIILGSGSQQERVQAVLDRIDRDIRVYIRIKTTLAVATAAFAYTVMAWVGVDFAAFWAVMVFFFYYIPTVGSILAIAAPAVLAWVQFDHLTPFLIVLLVFGTIQIVTANVVEPTIMGRTLNLSPLVVIVSLVVWGTIWGVVGMFLCVPIMVVALIVLAQFETTRPLAVLLSADGRIPEPQGEAA